MLAKMLGDSVLSKIPLPIKAYFPYVTTSVSELSKYRVIHGKNRSAAYFWETKEKLGIFKIPEYWEYLNYQYFNNFFIDMLYLNCYKNYRHSKSFLI